MWTAGNRLADPSKKRDTGSCRTDQAPPDSQLQQILDQESSLFTAQSADNLAGDLGSQPANGGPVFCEQPFSPGINSGSSFNPDAFSLFSGWSTATGSNSAAQQSIARGEVLFNSAHDDPVIPDSTMFRVIRRLWAPAPPVTMRRIQAAARISPSSISGPRPSVDLSSSVLLCNDGTQVTTTDPGRALVTGKCEDIGKVKIPGLQKLSARPPYFHNGSSAT